MRLVGKENEKSAASEELLRFLTIFLNRYEVEEAQDTPKIHAGVALRHGFCVTRCEKKLFMARQMV